MSTRSLALSGVICALSSVCVITSSLLHLIFPLVIACAFFFVCALRCGNACAVIVIVASNLIGFFVGGVGGGEIFFSVFLFSPFAVIVFATRKLKGTLPKTLVRALIFAVFSALVFVLFATVLNDFVGLGARFELGVGLLAAIWTAVMTAFGFALDRGVTVLTERYIKK